MAKEREQDQAEIAAELDRASPVQDEQQRPAESGDWATALGERLDLEFDDVFADEGGDVDPTNGLPRQARAGATVIRTGPIPLEALPPEESSWRDESAEEVAPAGVGRWTPRDDETTNNGLELSQVLDESLEKDSRGGLSSSEILDDGLGSDETTNNGLDMDQLMEAAEVSDDGLGSDETTNNGLDMDQLMEAAEVSDDGLGSEDVGEDDFVSHAVRAQGGLQDLDLDLGPGQPGSATYPVASGPYLRRGEHRKSGEYSLVRKRRRATATPASEGDVGDTTPSVEREESGIKPADPIAVANQSHELPASDDVASSESLGAGPQDDAPVPDSRNEDCEAEIERGGSAAGEALPSELKQALQRAREPLGARLLDLLAEELESEPDPARRALWHHERGHLQENELRQDGAAARSYAAALNLDPSLRPNLWVIRRTLITHGRWEQLVKLFDAELRVERDASRRVEILLEKGWLLLDRLGQPEQAAACLWQSHQESRGGWLVPLLALERIAIDRADDGLLARVYRGIADCAEDPEHKVAALRDLARLQERTGGAAGAERALETLDEVAALSIDRLGVLVQMEAITAQRGFERQRVAVLSALAQELLEGAEADPTEAAACLLEGAWLARSQLGDSALSQKLIQRAHLLCPEERLPPAELRLLAETEQDATLLVKLLERQFSDSDNPPEKTALSFRIALAQLRCGEHVAAARALGRCLELTPGYFPALVEIERAAMAEPDPQKLIDVWSAERKRLGEICEGRDQGPYQARLLWRAATVAGAALGDVAQSMQLCTEALACDPTSEAAQQLQVVLLLRAGQYEQLAELWQREADAADERGESAGAYLRQMVWSLAFGPLRHTSWANRALEQLNRSDPEDRYLLTRRCELLLREGRFEQLDRALAHLQQLELDPGRQNVLRLRRGAFLEHELGDDAQAAELYREVLASDPANTYALAALQVLLRRGGHVEQLAQLLETSAGSAIGAAQRRSLLLELGALYLGPLAAPDKAIAVYLDLLQQQTADLYLLRRLEVAARAAGRYDVLLDALRRQVELIEHPLSRARKRLQVAELREEQRAATEDVLRAYADAVQLAGDDVEVRRRATWGIARQHVRAERWSEARAAYAQLEPLMPPSLRGWLLEEQAWIASCEGNYGLAGDTWGRIAAEAEAEAEAEAAGSNQTICSTRVQLMRWLTAGRCADFGAWAEAAGQMAELTGDASLRVALQLQQAGLQRALTRDDSDPAPLRSILGEASHGPSVEALFQLLGCRGLAARERAAWLDELAAHVSAKYEDQLPLVLAQAHQEAGHPAAVALALQPLLAQDPNHLPALLLIQRTAASAGLAELEAGIWLRVAALLSDVEARGMAYGRAGALFEANAQPESAAKAYRLALAARPNDLDLMARLEEAYRDAHDYAGLEELVSIRLRKADKPNQRAALLFQRARLRRDHLSDARGAACDLLRVLSIEPNNPTALRDVAEICEENGDLDRACEYYGRLVETASQAEVQRTTVMRLASLLARRERLGDAAATCRQYLESYPQDEEVWEHLVELYLNASDRRRALEAIRRLSDLPAPPARKVARLRRLADFQWRQMSDPRLAREALLSALEVDATDLETLADLQRVCRELALDHEFRQPIERAKAEIRQAIGRAPLNAQLYERLSRLAEWSDDRHTLLGALGALCCFNAASEDEQQLYRRRVEHAPFEPQKQLPAHALHDLLATRQARGALGEVWRVIADVVPKLAPEHVVSDLVAYGASKDGRVSRDAAGVITRIANALNVGPLEVYVTRGDPRLVAGIYAETPQLIVGHTVASSLLAADRFRLGRTLYLLRDSATSLEQLPQDVIQRLLLAAVHAVEPAALKGISVPQIDDHSRQLQRMLSRAARRALPLAVNRLLQEGGHIEIAAWAEGVVMSANRAALLVCGDIIVALQQLVEELGDPRQRSRDDNVALLMRHAFAAQLLPFSVSEQYQDLRRELHL